MPGMLDIKTLSLLSAINLEKEKDVMIAVSGGGDSMALAHMLAMWSKKVKGPKIHGITVDHGLREESAKEAEEVKSWTKDFPNFVHKTLLWDEEKPATKLQENARFKRYDLLAGYAITQGIKALFVAHHQDDQGETFLIRLAKGSGLDGLACMERVFKRDDDLFIMRPLLDITHDALIAYCQEHELNWVEDPSNENEKFLRPRLRAARNVLEAEGLTNKRLSSTASRILRAKKALDRLTDRYFNDLVSCEEDKVMIDYAAWQSLDEEFRIRLLLRGFMHINPSQTYAPRMKKVENLANALFDQKKYKAQTLNGQKISLKNKQNMILFEKEAL